MTTPTTSNFYRLVSIPSNGDSKEVNLQEIVDLVGVRHVYKWAIKSNRIDVFALALDNNYWHNYSKLCYMMAKYGRLNMLKWVHENYIPYTFDENGIINTAALHGRLNIIKWIRTIDDEWSNRVCEMAARGGHLKILKWLRKNGCPWNERACMNASRRGHFHVLKWLHKHHCPWDATTCTMAIQFGHLHILQWALEHDCPKPTPHELKYKFKMKYLIPATKLIGKIKFDREILVRNWIHLAEKICDSLFYHDLSRLVQSFI
jgi:hypothetical protein